MSKLTRGQLTLLEPSGKVHKFGSPAIYSAEYPNPDKGATSGVADSLEVTLRVVADAFWLRMLLQSDLGFAESYMQGEVECSDLAGMFQVSGAGGAGVATGSRPSSGRHRGWAGQGAYVSGLYDCSCSF